MSVGRLTFGERYPGKKLVFGFAGTGRGKIRMFSRFVSVTKNLTDASQGFYYQFNFMYAESSFDIARAVSEDQLCIFSVEERLIFHCSVRLLC